MSLSEQEIKNIFLTDDILPLGQFETIPVTCTIDGKPESYPNVSLIYTNIDYKSLLDELLWVDSTSFTFSLYLR